MPRLKARLLIKFALLACAGQMALAQDSAVGPELSEPSSEAEQFARYLDSVREKAVAQGVKPETAYRVLGSLSYDERVVRLDRSQPETRPNAPIPMFAPYQNRHVDSARIGGGQRAFASLYPQLREIERETGVPGEVIMAIYGHETNYGRVTGNFHAPEALASLAFEGRRRDLFEGELIAVLKMIDMGVPRSAITGSWAGALGKPQFLPSVYLRLARDGDGDGYADIWNNETDAMASIANYFVQAGWRKEEKWGYAVNVPPFFDRNSVSTRLKPPRCERVFGRHSQWKTISEWRALGITPSDGERPDDKMMATLIEPDGPNKTAYLLGGNYRVILDYNCSNFYALSVGLLAEAIRN